MTEELETLKIIKEDILEVVGRKNEKLPLRLMKLEVTASHSFVSKAIKELQEENLVKVSSEKKSEEYIQLTKEGKVIANDIIEKHSILEKYFEERGSKEEAINATNLLEHYISTEAINNIRKLSTFQKEGIPLTKFKKKEGLIVDIGLDVGLLERAISMGIYPGERIKILYKIPNGFVVNVSRKKIAIGEDIAKEIKVST